MAVEIDPAFALDGLPNGLPRPQGTTLELGLGLGQAGLDAEIKNLEPRLFMFRHTGIGTLVLTLEHIDQAVQFPGRGNTPDGRSYFKILHLPAVADKSDGLEGYRCHRQAFIEEVFPRLGLQLVPDGVDRLAHLRFP